MAHRIKAVHYTKQVCILYFGSVFNRHAHQIKTAYYKQSFNITQTRTQGARTPRSRSLRSARRTMSWVIKLWGGNTTVGSWVRQTCWEPAAPPAERVQPQDSRAEADTPRLLESPAKNIFDFDAFIRSHYGEQLKREQETRQRREELVRKKKEQVEDMKLGRMKEVAVGVMLAIAAMILFSLKSSKWGRYRDTRSISHF